MYLLSYCGSKALWFVPVSWLCRFSEMLEQADDMAIDVPFIWLYLAELLSPLLREGGISMRELFRSGFHTEKETSYEFCLVLLCNL